SSGIRLRHRIRAHSDGRHARAEHRHGRFLIGLKKANTKKAALAGRLFSFRQLFSKLVLLQAGSSFSRVRMITILDKYDSNASKTCSSFYERTPRLLRRKLDESQNVSAMIASTRKTRVGAFYGCVQRIRRAYRGYLDRICRDCV
ncbi:MAG: hypothetical protein AB7O79_09765, partial [Xanthobacteraceae bacterium]